MKRIRLVIARFGFPEADIKEKVKADEMFAAHFAKEPRRTGLHEKRAAEWAAGGAKPKDAEPKGVEKPSALDAVLAAIAKADDEDSMKKAAALAGKLPDEFQKNAAREAYAKRAKELSAQQEAPQI